MWISAGGQPTARLQATFMASQQRCFALGNTIPMNFVRPIRQFLKAKNKKELMTVFCPVLPWTLSRETIDCLDTPVINRLHVPN
jgi:hypothetical protein